MKSTGTFTIKNNLGLHARAAAAFVKVANRFHSEIFVQKDDTRVNGKSIMGVLMLAASRGTCIEITVTGLDSQEALDALENLIEEKFGEE